MGDFYTLKRLWNRKFQFETFICPCANGQLFMDEMGSDIFIFKFKLSALPGFNWDQ
jgi:hypothetical protein